MSIWMISLFEILQYSVGSLFWGILWTLLGMALLFFLIKGFYPKSVFTPISLVTGVVLFFFLAFQSILICGAVKVKSLSAELETSIDGYIPNSWKQYGKEVTAADSQQIVENLGVDYALFSHYINWADFEGHSADKVASAMVEEFNSFLNAFIWRRVGWSLFFVLLGTFMVIRTLGTIQTYTHHRRGGSSSRRRHNDF